MEAAFVLSLASLVLKYGAPMALKIVQAWKVENPTAEDFEDLRNAVPIDEEFIS